VRSYVLECVCPDEITQKRLEKRLRDNDNASDGRWELFQKQKDDFEAITEVPENYHFRIDTSANPELTRHEFIRKVKLEE
jgi:predicted kinase